MRKVLSCFLIVLFAYNIAVSFNVQDVKADNNTQTEVSRYALSWAGNKNIPYIHGDYGESLEWLAATKGRGTDCSGFTSLVYKHFGIKITSSSSKQKTQAKKIYTNIKDAVPGDIVWWPGHVAIYIGDGKIVHTNTPKPPYNYPHVEDIDYSPKGDPIFLRMVDDVSELKPLSGSDASSVNNTVKNTERSGSIVTESDLTGMPTEWSIDDGTEELPEITELSTGENYEVSNIRESITERKATNWGVLSAVLPFIGLFIIIWGILLAVAYLFDRSNNLIEISLLRILTLGKYAIWDEDMNIEPGYNKQSKTMYCNSSIIIKRIIMTELVGFALVSGYFLKFLTWVFKYVVSLLGIVL